MRTIEINYPGIDDNSQGRRCLHFDISSFLTFRHFKYIYIYKIQSLRSGLHLQTMRFYGQKCQVVSLSSLILGTWWRTSVFMSMLRSQCLLVKIVDNTFFICTGGRYHMWLLLMAPANGSMDVHYLLWVINEHCLGHWSISNALGSEQGPPQAGHAGDVTGPFNIFGHVQKKSRNLEKL